MLTGHPPFDGETPAEVLMKHQLDTPDLKKRPDATRVVLARALEKDPTKRYQSIMEFAKAVDGIFGGPRADAVAAAAHTPLNGKTPTADTVVDEKRRAKAIPVAKPLTSTNGPGTFRERLTELAGGFALTPLVCLACTAPWALVANATPWAILGQVFLLSTAPWGALGSGATVSARREEPVGARSVHLAIGVGIGALVLWLDGWTVPRHDERDVERSGLRQRPSRERTRSRAASICSTGLAWVRAVVGRGRPGGAGTHPLLPDHRGGILGERVLVPVAVGFGAGDRGDRTARDRGRRGRRGVRGVRRRRRFRRLFAFARPVYA